MLECWQQNPGLRPSFADLVPSLDSMLEMTVNEVRFVLNGSTPALIDLC